MAAVFCRFIPTHVGNTTHPAGWLPHIPVHPHACGEHNQHFGLIVGQVGSSPRMWGTPPMTRELMIETRFIPTHVGNTSGTTTDSSFLAVHPHACGEHPGRELQKSTLNGSSPRMWGTLTGQRAPRSDDRFIPTHVGNTAVLNLTNAIVAVHPHACGEHPSFHLRASNTAGSSPRMWGTRARGGSAREICRFIPTHVGNTERSHRPHY